MVLHVNACIDVAYHEADYHQPCNRKCFNWYAKYQLRQNCRKERLLQQHASFGWPLYSRLTYVVIKHLRQGIRTISMDASSFSLQLYDIVVLQCILWLAWLNTVSVQSVPTVTLPVSVVCKISFSVSSRLRLHCASWLQNFSEGRSQCFSRLKVQRYAKLHLCLCRFS